MYRYITLLFLLSLAVESRSNFSQSMKSGNDCGWPFRNIKFDHPVQSPIDIITSKSKFRMLPQLKLVSHLSTNLKTVVNNTGHTVYIFLAYESKNQEERPYIIGGPLKDKYYFEQIHMHWGSQDRWGSEHFLDGESFSTEGHAVHYNSKYKNFKEASLQPDGLCVLTLFAEAVDYPNRLLQPLVNALDEISEPGQYKVLQAVDALTWFLSAKLNNDGYYTYPGSLTTSPYSENVIFISFPRPITLSHEQLNKFRTLHNAEEGQFILENKRELQPVNNRPIIKSCINPLRCAGL